MNGVVQSVTPPNLNMTPDGTLSRQGEIDLANYLAKTQGHGISPIMHCDDNADAGKVNAYARSFAKDHPPYNWANGNHCSGFAYQAFKAGGGQ
jgi:hypothetical protein